MYGIMRVEKRKRQSITGLEGEANRSADNQKDFPNSDIDWNKTKDNYYFKRTDGWLDEINTRIKDFKVRKDAILMLDGLFTATPEFFENKTKNDVIKYFQDCLDFYVDTYCHGDSSLLLNAEIHFDETTPHMCVASIPITADEKLSAKDIIGNVKAMCDRQDDFYETVTKKYGLKRGERTKPGEKKKHRDVMQCKVEDLERQVEDLKYQHVDLLQTIDKQNEVIEEQIKVIEEQQDIIDKNIEKNKRIFERTLALKEEEKAIQKRVDDLKNKHKHEVRKTVDAAADKGNRIESSAVKGGAAVSKAL